MNVRHLPNLLGLFRILATPFLLGLISQHQAEAYLWAAGLLLLMALSDFLDGYLARSFKVVSPLGIFLDTISDKIFVAGALLPMVENSLLPSWVALLIIERDLVISGLRSFAATEGQVITASNWGKQKQTLMVTMLIWRLLAASAEVSGKFPSFPNSQIWQFLFSLWPIPLFLTVIWTVLSALDYLWKTWPLLRGGWSPLREAPLTPEAQPSSTSTSTKGSL